jgi:hypothetical protein
VIFVSQLSGASVFFFSVAVTFVFSNTMTFSYQSPLLNLVSVALTMVFSHRVLDFFSSQYAALRQLSIRTKDEISE